MYFSTRMIDKQNFNPSVIKMVHVKEEKEHDSIDQDIMIQDLIENNKTDSLEEEKPEILEFDKELQQLWKGLVDQLFQSIQESFFELHFVSYSFQTVKHNTQLSVFFP